MKKIMRRKRISKTDYKNLSEIKGRIAIYRAENGKAELEAKLEKETVWLSQVQMTELFDKDVRTISEHIQNLYNRDYKKQ